jgi:pimeloyl-ACP methyl ester carboxylesterase
MREEVVLFGQAKSLVGVITNPDYDYKHLPAIIFLNSGLLHRVGPSRLYVKMARNLAEMGFVSLRVDFSGIGDSEVRTDALPLEQSGVSETQEAMDFLSSTRGIKQFILVGICSGAYFALRTACCDPRVVGAIPIEGYGSLTARYYWSRFVNPIGWWRAITGKKEVRDSATTAWNFIKSLTAKPKTLLTPKPQAQPTASLTADVHLLTERGVDLLLVYAKGSPAFYNFVKHRNLFREPISSRTLQVEVIEGTDHTFTPLSIQQHLMKVIENWAQIVVTQVATY